jgi:hypothetical protein
LDRLLHLLDGLVKMVQDESEQLLGQLRVPRRHVEYKMFCVSSNVKHQPQIFQA